MIKTLLSFIEKKKLFNTNDNILLVVSGGIDSIVLCDLFYKTGLKFGIAHCNFQLRGKESDEDEKFVNSIAKKYKVEFYTTTFDTLTYAKLNKVSVQVAARELRYKWFEDIRKQYDYKYISTAHHQNDSIETFFINLVRGTGIAGLHGILPKQGNIIHPLLFAKKDEIINFAKKNKLKYREDSSNASDKYVRNKIRHHIIPVLKELNPSIEETITKDIEKLQEIELIYKKEIESKYNEVAKVENKNTLISIPALKKSSPINPYLFEYLKPYNFNSNTVNDILHSLDGSPGKQFFSDTHRLIKDRDLLVIEPIINKGEEEVSILVKENKKEITLDNLKIKFKTLKQKSEIPKSVKIGCFNFDTLKFPLEVRKWKEGDFFYPLGMKGKKKLSDFFIDRKLSLIQKNAIWLLTSEGKIVWVIGQRIDDRFKITKKTTKIYFAELV